MTAALCVPSLASRMPLAPLVPAAGLHHVIIWTSMQALTCSTNGSGTRPQCGPHMQSTLHPSCTRPKSTASASDLEIQPLRATQGTTQVMAHGITGPCKRIHRSLSCEVRAERSQLYESSVSGARNGAWQQDIPRHAALEQGHAGCASIMRRILITCQGFQEPASRTARSPRPAHHDDLTQPWQTGQGIEAGAS